MSSTKFLVPRKLDEPPRAFFWDFDVALVFMVPLGFGIIAGKIMLPAICGFIAAAMYSKAKSGQHPGYLVHTMYWHLPLSLGFRRTPPSYEREFCG